MAHESFEDEETARYLNEHFISIKVDKEERPDIDSIYMSVCQAFTGSGGWPMSIFMTPDQKPFFAGTYFPKKSSYGMRTFLEILTAIQESWTKNRKRLFESAEEVVSILSQSTRRTGDHSVDSTRLFDNAKEWFESSFDARNGGFGGAPKFPIPHNLWFLLMEYEQSKEQNRLKMVEKTLIQMYRGGLFDHIGFGFSRYSTDSYFLAPHFEKMLYDNALLILVYSKAYAITGKAIYCDIAQKAADFILREMTDEEGGFYCAQDADVEGEEGKYYLFTPDEIEQLLGEQEGKRFNQYYDITQQGNFEGKNIPNLLKSTDYGQDFSKSRVEVYEYRKNRYRLHLDDKILTSWNGLMIGALCYLYRVSRDSKYIEAARKAQHFLEVYLFEETTCYVSYREGRNQTKGFLEDYANGIFALLCLYEATLETTYMERARSICQKVIEDFWDEQAGGFFLYGDEHETLILRPKETYDGAMPSGNSMMAYNLVVLNLLMEDTKLREMKNRQLEFMTVEARRDSSNYTMFLIALLMEENPPEKIVVVPKEGMAERLRKELPLKVSWNSIVCVLQGEEEGYRMKHGETTYYICKGHTCLKGTNTLEVEE